MDIVFHLLIIVICIVGLWIGSTQLVESAVRIARKIGMSELVIGLTIVAIGTSAPEFAVTISSAVSGSSDISVGNIIGSNIFNLGFILGGVVAIRAIATNKTLVYRDGGMLIATAIALLIFFLDGELVAWESVALLIGLVGYVGYLITQREKSAEELPEGEYQWTDTLRLLIGMVIIVASGHFLVHSAVIVAKYAGISEWIIGLTIVAAGTSAPELATSLTAAIKGHGNLSIGNLIGSDLFNTLGVLGLAGLIQVGRGSTLAITDGYTDFLVLAGMILCVVFFMRSGWKMKRWEGFLLVGVNLIRWVWNFI